MKGEILSLETVMKISELKKENKDLKFKLIQQGANMTFDILDLKEKIDKAIKYIEEHQTYNSDINGYELVSILRGNDNE